MTTGPQYPASGEGDREEVEAPLTRPAQRGEEQEPPQGGRPGKGPLGHPYGGSADVPEDAEGLPGEWESHEVHEQPPSRPSGRV